MTEILEGDRAYKLTLLRASASFFLSRTKSSVTSVPHGASLLSSVGAGVSASVYKDQNQNVHARNYIRSLRKSRDKIIR